MEIPGSQNRPAGKDSPQALIVQDGVARPANGRSMTVPARPAALSAQPNVAGLLIALRRRWLLATFLGLLVAPAAAAAVWVMRPITFTAKTTLHVKSTPDKIMFELPESRGDFSNYQRVQVALVKSRLVLNSALQDPKVESLPMVQREADPVAWLERSIQADFSTAPEILRISMTGEDPISLPMIVDAVRRAYLHEIVQKETRARQARLDKLREMFADNDGILRGKRDTLKRMATSLGSQDKKLLAVTQEFSAQHLRELQSELLKRESELRTTQLELVAQMTREKATSGASIPDRTLEDQLKLDATILRLQKEIADHEADIAAFEDRSPAPQKEAGYQRAVKALETAKASLSKRRDELRPQIVGKVRGTLHDDQQVLTTQLNNRVAFLIELKDVLAKEIEARTKDVNSFKLEVVDLEWLQDEILNLDTFNKEVTRQMTALQVEIQAPPRVTELEEAIVAPAQTESSRMRMAGGAGAGAFLAALFGVAFLEFRRRRVNDADEVVQALRMRLVGQLPLVPRRALLGRSTSARNLEWQNRLTESVDAIRTTLLNAARLEGLRRVMVTSAVGGEGKTLLSCHLAVSLARAGCKTLLIDGDLRRPSVHKLFNLAVENGLSDLLRGEVQSSDITNPGPLDGLSVITAGHSDRQAIQMLSRDRLGEILRQLSNEYEFVIIDSAPVLPVADAQLIGQHVDGVVLSVMRHVSRLPSVYAACERLSMLGVRILGAVVNGMQGNYYQSSPYYNTPLGAGASPVTEKQTA
jgi:capsular exopolysaccharide synthesis family protein